MNTGRDTLAGASESVVSSLSGFGATVVTDTCTYITPIMASATGPVMTNSGKWAYYAPGNLGIDVVLGGLEECVKSAETGQIRLSDPFVT